MVKCLGRKSTHSLCKTWADNQISTLRPCPIWNDRRLPPNHPLLPLFHIQPPNHNHLSLHPLINPFTSQTKRPRGSRSSSSIQIPNDLLRPMVTRYKCYIHSQIPTHGQTLFYPSITCFGRNTQSRFARPNKTIHRPRSSRCPVIWQPTTPFSTKCWITPH